jgi:two-component sensor histidine kinase
MDVGRSNSTFSEVGERDHGRSQDETPTANFAGALQEVLSSSVLCEGHNISIEKNIGHANMLAVDVVKLTRVLTNILDNAAEAIKPNGGKIWIRTRDIKHSSGNWVGITIGNSNSFIASEDLSRLFDAFYTKNKTGGTGLGLAIVKKIVGAYGGEIICESSQEQGTQFHFTLPAWEQKGNNHIIVVDDCPFIRAQWADLQSLKQVKTFSSPDEFWQACKSDESILREAMSVVTDFYFDSDSTVTGLDFAESTRSAGYNGPLYISSDAPIDRTDVIAVNALMVAKDPRLAMAAVGEQSL